MKSIPTKTQFCYTIKDMVKITPIRPILFILYGFPGAGKTYFSRQLNERILTAHIQADRIRGELLEKPRFDKQENDVIMQLMNYMAEEFLNNGISVVYDNNAMRFSQRPVLREMARRAHVQPLLIWFQTDIDTAFARNTQRDRRSVDDKSAAGYERKTFASLITHMQNPTPAEDYVVVSGKHTFNAQYSAVVRKLREMELISSENAIPVVKPGLVNLIPQPNLYRGRVDTTRRNIVIR